MSVRAGELPAAVRSWLGQPALTRLWDNAHRRLQQNGRTATGRLRLSDVDDLEREALSLLLGRRFTSAGVTIDLAELDAVLRSSAAALGLLAVVEALRGPVMDRRGQRHERAAVWDAVWSACTESLVTTGLSGSDWAQLWLEEIRTNGSVTRLGPQNARRVIEQAVAVLATLLPMPTGLSGRGELAERFTGTAHGLDDDTVLARLVLRGLAHAYGLQPPAEPQAKRRLWETAGVWPDGVSSTALTYALTTLEEGWFPDLLRQRAEQLAETHLTVRDLRRIQWRLPPGTTVFVCENPRVVEAAADAGCTSPLVCTSGNPTYTVLALLDALVESGATLLYRGDFDWPGVAMANRIIARYGAWPWRMNSGDYEQHVATARSRGTPLQQLSGQPVQAEWDAELTAAMRTIDVAVHEESALELLLSDLWQAR
jgi:uncharacterized protein (TIGR02679 family)